MSVPNSISSCLTIQIKYLILSNPILWYTTSILAKNEAETSIANMLEYLIYNICVVFCCHSFDEQLALNRNRIMAPFLLTCLFFMQTKLATFNEF